MEDEVLEQTSGVDAQANEQVVENQDAATGDTEAAIEQENANEPAFTPDYKFRANQQDMEIPEEFRAHIKDVESQKRMKDMFEKFHGFETQKTKLSSLEQDVTKYRGGYEGIVNNLQDIQQGYAHAVQSGNLHNLDMVFQKLGLGEDVLMAWAGEKAKLAGLEPEQQRAIMHSNKLEREAYEHGQHQNYLMNQNQQKDLQIRQMQFDSAMAAPQIQGFAQELDGKFGMAGFFAEEVVKAGQMAYALEKKVLSVPEAMQAVITKYGLKGQAQQVQPQGQGNANGQQGGNVSADGKKIIQRDNKVIPNIGSASGASPVGTGKAKNLDDVRKRYAELMAQG